MDFVRFPCRALHSECHSKEKTTLSKNVFFATNYKRWILLTGCVLAAGLLLWANRTWSLSGCRDWNGEVVVSQEARPGGGTSCPEEEPFFGILEGEALELAAEAAEGLRLRWAGFQSNVISPDPRRRQAEYYLLINYSYVTRVDIFAMPDGSYEGELSFWGGNSNYSIRNAERFAALAGYLKAQASENSRPVPEG